MWERKELKNKAKKVVYKNYWTIVVVCFLIALLTGEFGTSILGVWQSEDSMDPNYIFHHEIDKIGIQDEEIKTFFSEEKIKDVLNETQIKVFETVEDNLNSALKSQKYIFKIWDAITFFLCSTNKVGNIALHWCSDCCCFYSVSGRSIDCGRKEVLFSGKKR